MIIEEDIMNREKFIELLKERKLSEQQISESIKTVLKMEDDLLQKECDLSTVTTEQIVEYVSKLPAEKENTIQNLIALARIFYIHDRKGIYIYFLKVLGGIGVIDNIRRRMEKYAGKEITEEIFNNLEEPPLGTDFKKIPEFTTELMKRVEEKLPPDQFELIFAGNNHGLSEKAMKSEKERWQNSSIMPIPEKSGLNSKSHRISLILSNPIRKSFLPLEKMTNSM
jgi:hypothetical protein